MKAKGISAAMNGERAKSAIESRNLLAVRRRLRRWALWSLAASLGLSLTAYACGNGTWLAGAAMAVAAMTMMAAVDGTARNMDQTRGDQ